MNGSRADRGIWDTLDRIRSTLELSEERWNYLLRMSPEEECRRRRAGQSIPESALLRIAEHLDLLPETILSGQVDYDALLGREAGAWVDYLPARYMPGAGSKRRTSMHLLNFVEIHHGWRESERVLRNLQLPRSAMSEPDAPINILFLQDLCEYFLQNGKDEGALYRMGTYSVLANLDSPVAGEFRKARSLQELYTKFVEEIAPANYDRNYDYRIIEADEDHCVFEATVNQDTADALGIRLLGSPGVCAEKSGLIASTAAYLNVPLAEVRQTRCIHEGHPSCRFEVDYSLAAHVHSSRLKRPA